MTCIKNYRKINKAYVNRPFLVSQKKTCPSENVAKAHLVGVFTNIFDTKDNYCDQMKKLDEDGKPIYNDAGKVMKGPNYFKPDLSKFVS